MCAGGSAHYGCTIAIVIFFVANLFKIMNHVVCSARTIRIKSYNWEERL